MSLTMNQYVRRYFVTPLLFLTAVGLVATGCDALEGPQGEQGPPGEDGEQGPPGEQGPQGPAGPGPSVVKFSFDESELESRSGRGAREAFVQEISEIDSAVVDSGTVLAYLEQYQNGNISQSSVEMKNQNSTNGESVIVESVFVPQDGYVAIHDSTLLDGDAVGSVIGVSQYLEAGSYEQVEIALYQGVPGQSFNQSSLQGDQQLIAMPHRENNDNQEYNFVSSDGSADGPFTSAGEVVVDPAFVTIGNDAEVILNDQESDGETITVRSVYVPEDGYVAIHDTSDAIIGVSEYLDPGFYNNLSVTLFEDFPGKDFPADTTLPGDQSLVAMPHEETSDPDVDPDEPEFNFVSSGGNEDIPYFVENNSDNGAVTDSGFITVASSSTGSNPMTNVNGDPNTSWASLPLDFFVDTDDSDGNDDADAEVNVDYTHDHSQVTVLFTAMDQLALDQLDGEFNVKVVVVPPEAEGSGSSSSQSSSNVEYDFSTYEEAAEHFGLTEEDMRVVRR